jgi:hypothetical protein
MLAASITTRRITCRPAAMPAFGQHMSGRARVGCKHQASKWASRLDGDSKEQNNCIKMIHTKMYQAL